MFNLRTKTIIIISILIILAIFVSYLIYYVYNLPKTTVGNCDAIKAANPDTKWSSDCSYIEELQLDNSIETPTDPMYLTSFTSSPALGQPLGANVWYKYNYVNSKTGNYGKSSPWTKTPIFAGSNNLPCRGSNCEGVNFSGKDSCKSNLVKLSIDKLAYPFGSDDYANVHRYTTTLSDNTPPDDSIKGKIVGMIYPSGSGGMFIDISSSPCKDVACTNIVGC